MAASVFLIGLVPVVGWLLNIPRLTNITAGSSSMKVNTGLALMLAATALALLNRPRRATATWIARVLAALVLFLGVLTGAEYVLSLDLGIDEWLVAAPPDPATPFLSRMSPITALCLGCAGFALLTLDARPERRLRPFELATTIMLLIATLGIVGYAYGAPALYQIGTYSPIALHTALAFVALGYGILAARPEPGIVGLLARYERSHAGAAPVAPSRAHPNRVRMAATCG